MVRLLLVLVLGFAALSSTAAEALGLSEERIVLFTGALALLLLLPFLIRPNLISPPASLVVLFLLLVPIAVLDARGQVDLLDYRIVLLLLVIMASPNLGRSLAGIDFDRFVWRLLSLYVVVTFAYQTFGQPAAVARGYGGITRYDPTGSVVMHASLATIHLALAATRALTDEHRRRRLVAAALGACSAILVLSTATRTVLVTGALMALFHVLTARRRVAALRLVGGVGLAGVLVFAAYATFWDASFVGRLQGEDAEDWGSGRWPSIKVWLDLLGDQPMGLGLGTVRETLSPGKPWLDGEMTLEWPHDEFIRYLVEAGPLGLAFISLLLFTLVRTALRAAVGAHPVRRALLLVLASDLIAESLFQNLFNAIYHATVLVLLLCLAAQPEPLPEPDTLPEPGQPGLPVPS